MHRQLGQAVKIRSPRRAEKSLVAASKASKRAVSKHQSAVSAQRNTRYLPKEHKVHTARPSLSSGICGEARSWTRGAPAADDNLTSHLSSCQLSAAAACRQPRNRPNHPDFFSSSCCLQAFCAPLFRLVPSAAGMKWSAECALHRSVHFLNPECYASLRIVGAPRRPAFSAVPETSHQIPRSRTSAAPSQLEQSRFSSLRLFLCSFSFDSCDLLRLFHEAQRFIRNMGVP